MTRARWPSRSALLAAGAAFASLAALWPHAAPQSALAAGEPTNDPESSSEVVMRELLEPEPVTSHEIPTPTLVAQPAPMVVAEHPHPITQEHRRLQRELQLIGALNDALDLKDVSALRKLIALHEREYPDDANALRVGYARIADCLESPGTQSREAAQDYYTRERASTLRRYVRRLCLDSEN